MREFGRREVLALAGKSAGALAAASLMPGMFGAGAMAQSEDTIRFAYQPGFAYGLFYVAQAKGWFKEAGVSLDPMTVFTNGPIQIDAVINGDLDATVQGFVPLLTRAAGNQPVRIIDVVDNSGRTYAVVGTKAIDGVPGLKGKTVGVNRGSNYDYFLGEALTKFGMSIADLNIVNFGDPVKAQAAFVAGQVDAIVPITTSREAILQQRANAKVIFSATQFTEGPNPSKAPFAIYDLLATTDKALSKHHDGFVKLMQVFHTRVYDYITSEKTQSAAIDDIYDWQKTVIKAEVTKEQILANIKNFEFYNKEKARQVVASGELQTFLEKISKFLVDNKLLPSAPDVSKIIDAGPAKAMG
ncbi:NMT1/THI5 like [Xaviernesmea oryzae]|uniref:NMT1/THI5 like n=1 Tax=Xaviernesmea oryzae TaxID=464029 RepID=A0A1X7DXQ2_9HYPH|nr:ABC transporter substrate-binding protein [Xaviernesmea oryzae]SMF23468.1 NMT1/THI5 like [Xaviernesmea oryzae]